MISYTRMNERRADRAIVMMVDGAVDGFTGIGCTLEVKTQHGGR